MTALPPIVVFDYAAFVAAFPQFAGLSEPMLASFFAQADLYFANDATNPAYGAWGLERTTLLMYQVTAHLAWLGSPKDAAGNPSTSGTFSGGGLVGQVTSASQGSVSASVKAVSSESAEFWAQTPYGFAFWQATAAFRTMRYLAHPTFVPSAIYPARPRGWRW